MRKPAKNNMKKLLVLSIFLSLFLCIDAKNDETSSCDSNNIETVVTQNVQVVKFTYISGTRAYVKNYYDATYNREDNSITIYDKSQPVCPIVLSVYKNRAYGQENDHRAEYEYCSGEYFYNL